MDLTNPKDLRLALDLAGLKLNKELGQHFLIDRVALATIIESAQLAKDDTVLEIGPGIGTLTAALMPVAGRVVAVEKDPRFIDILQKQFSGIEVHNQDFNDFNLDEFDQYKVVANLPYYITSKILQALLTAQNPPSSITVLVQKEVARRITAVPGQMSVLAFSVQYFGRPRLVATVPATSFWPAPEVNSAILHIAVLPQPVFAADQSALFRLVKAGFGEKRKMLRNSLAGGLQISPKVAAELLQAANIKSSARAQELDMQQWRQLYDVATARQLLA